MFRVRSSRGFFSLGRACGQVDLCMRARGRGSLLVFQPPLRLIVDKSCSPIIAGSRSNIPKKWKQAKHELKQPDKRQRSCILEIVKQFAVC